MAIAPTHPHTRTYPDLAQFSATAPGLLSRSVDRDPPRPLVVDGDVVLDLARLRERVVQAQQALHESGVQRGDVVSMQLPNWWEAVAFAHAVWGIGAVLNPVTPIYRASELRMIFNVARPTLVITPGVYREVDYAEMSRSALKDASLPGRVLSIRDFGRTAGVFETGDLGKDLEVYDDCDEISVLMFTSGTTGTPKGVLHSQRTLSYEAWSIADRFSLTRCPVFMPSPLTHITGLLYGVLLPLIVDGTVVLLDRWDPSSAVSEIEANRCTFSIGATPFLAGLVTAYERLGTGSSLEWFVCGGADVPASLVRAASTVMGTGVVRAYGLTELPTLSCGSPSDTTELLESTDGGVVGSSEARLAHEIEGVGELEIHGPEMFLGYLDPAHNADAFTSDGWFRTGDLARLGDYHVTIAGRLKDVIVRGGENISAKEVEDLILELPNVADVAVVGVADPVLGERACAVIVPHGSPPTLEELAACLDASQVARQKIPEFLLLTDALPRTASGKVQKFLVRADAQARLTAEQAVER